MRMIIKGICKNPLKNSTYIVLLIVAFVPIILLLNTYFMGLEIIHSFEATVVSDELLGIQSNVLVTMLSLLLIAALIIFLCVVVLPFLQYLFSLGRGYEIGVLRALGLSRGKAWFRLFLENILLIVAAFVLSICVSLATHKQFAFSLLSISTETEQLLIETFGNIFHFHWLSVLYTLYTAAIVTLISSMLSNILISNTAPLKIIQRHK